jgi:SAM-dependent methyltransferase
MPRKEHWEQVYSTRATDAVSWFQPRATVSLELIRATGVPTTAALIDVGGGASTLVDDLLALGYADLTVLDLAGAALDAAQRRLGPRADRVTWLEADITTAKLPAQAYDIWHDRAVFHFLTEPTDRRAYVDAVLHALRPGGHLLVATFAEDGPERCSGLPVVRYGADALLAEFGPSFRLVRQLRESHHTPFDTVQPFNYCWLRKTAGETR